MIRTLITCVGSGVGQSVVDSLYLNEKYYTIGCDASRNLYATSLCDEFVFMPYVEHSKYADHVLNLCIDYNIDILIPGHDFELLLYSKNIDKFHKKGIKVIVSEPDLIEVSRNKQHWYDYFFNLGCNIVPTLSVKEFKLNPIEDFYPSIVKPAAGSASQGIRIINNIQDLDGTNDDDIIQPYLFPEESDSNFTSIVKAVKNGKFIQKSEISIQLLFSSSSKFSGIFISKNTLKNGIPIFVDPIDPDNFSHMNEVMKFVPILESKKVKGPVNIQGRITEKGLFFFEMNMRFTGITGTRALLGFNEVDLLINNFLNLTYDKIENYAINKLGVRQVACSTISRPGIIDSNSTITILGGGSLIGQNFILNKLRDHKRINLIVRDQSIKKYKDIFSNTNIKLIGLNSSSLQQTLCNSDVFINFASALAYEKDELKFDAIRNIFSVVKKIMKGNIPFIINISSQSVYPQNINIKKAEDHELENISSYAFQKIIIEDYFNSVSEMYPNSTVLSLRLPRVISPRNIQQSGFFGKLIKQYKLGEKIEISNPQNNLNLIHIDDVINSIQFILDNKLKIHSNKVLNVSGVNLTLKDYCNKIKELIVSNGEFVFSKETLISNSSMIDGTKIEKLGFKPLKSLDDIIIELNENSLIKKTIL